MESKLLLILLTATIAVSGCADSSNDTRYAQLVGEVSDRTVASDSPGEIKLNAENLGNETSFHVIVEPVGDYSQVVEITDRDGEAQRRINLGTAVEGATTGERFAHVQKKLNITSSVKVKAKLYSQRSEESVDSQIYHLNVQEN